MQDIPPASATPPPGDTVYEPDLRLGLSIVNWLHQAVHQLLDGFICAVGCGCMYASATKGGCMITLKLLPMVSQKIVI
jgi:hypothetical protein